MHLLAYQCVVARHRQKLQHHDRLFFRVLQHRQQMLSLLWVHERDILLHLHLALLPVWTEPRWPTTQFQDIEQTVTHPKKYLRSLAVSSDRSSANHTIVALRANTDHGHWHANMSFNCFYKRAGCKRHRLKGTAFAQVCFPTLKLHVFGLNST